MVCTIPTTMDQGYSTQRAIFIELCSILKVCRAHCIVATQQLVPGSSASRGGETRVLRQKASMAAE